MKLCAKVTQPVRVVVIISRVQTDTHDQIKAAAVARWWFDRGRISDDWNTWSSILTHLTHQHLNCFVCSVSVRRCAELRNSHTNKPQDTTTAMASAQASSAFISFTHLTQTRDFNSLYCSLAPSPPSQWIKAVLRVSPWQPLCKWWSVFVCC